MSDILIFVSMRNFLIWQMLKPLLNLKIHKNLFKMKKEKLQNFIAEKIEDLKYAIFFCYNNDDFHINNSIIRSSTVNENGTITYNLSQNRLGIKSENK